MSGTANPPDSPARAAARTVVMEMHTPSEISHTEDSVTLNAFTWEMVNLTVARFHGRCVFRRIQIVCLFVNVTCTDLSSRFRPKLEELVCAAGLEKYYRYYRIECDILHAYIWYRRDTCAGASSVM